VTGEFTGFLKEVYRVGSSDIPVANNNHRDTEALRKTFGTKKEIVRISSCFGFSGKKKSSFYSLCLRASVVCPALSVYPYNSFPSFD
jgi:hypothetical protein